MKRYGLVLGCLLLVAFQARGQEVHNSCEVSIDFGQEEFSQEDDMLEMMQPAEQPKVVQWAVSYMGPLLVWYLENAPRYEQYKKNIRRQVRRLLRTLLGYEKKKQ